MAEKKEAVKEEKKPRYELAEVSVQTAWVVKDNSTNKVLNDKELITEILNKLDKIERTVG